MGRARKRIPVWMRQRVCPGKRTTAPDRSASAGERVASGSTIVVSGRRPMPPRTGGTDKATRADRSSAFPGLRKGGRASVRGTRCVRISIGVRRAGNRGALGEVVDDERTALVVEPNGKEFVVAMLRLINDARLRKNLSEAGRREVEQRFSAGRMVDSTIRVYEDVLLERRKG